MKKIFYALFLFAAVLISSCHKEPKANIITGPNVPGSTLDMIKDSVFLYAKEDYLWYSALPTYLAFQPRSYTGADDADALTNELNQISQIPINPATSLPYEYNIYASYAGEAKYSFIDNGQTEAELNGNRGDFGFGLQWYTTTDMRITYVYPGSPAALAGLKRGDQVTSINGSTSLTYDYSGSKSNYNFVVNAYQNSNTITLILKKADGSTLTANLNIANYNVTPVLKDTTYTLGNGKVVGYLVFNSFVSDDIADPELDAAMANFAAAGVTDLVVDLRYNGGGYVSTAEYLDNLIVPAAKSGTLMYNTYYNNTLQAGKEVLLKNQWRYDAALGKDINYGPDYVDYSVAANTKPFAKKGSLNVNNVYFIMTSHTASASELTINNLRPEMNVQFVGETSYGKPVGFFDIDINQYTMYIPEFYVENSANQGDYYQGFTPGTTTYPGVLDADDMTKDFGDPTEGLLADVLNYVQTGTYSVQKPVVQSLPSKQQTLAFHLNNKFTSELNSKTFNGMVIDTKSLKLKKRP